MNSVVKHIVRNLFEKKFRTVIVLVTVLLSTLVVFIGLSLNEIISHTYTTMLKGANGDSNIIVSKNGGDPFYEEASTLIAGPKNRKVTAGPMPAPFFQIRTVPCSVRKPIPISISKQSNEVNFGVQ